MMLGACAAQKPAGYAVFPAAAKISVERLDPVDRLKPDQTLYVEAAHPPINGTVELFAPGDNAYRGPVRPGGSEAGGNTAIDCKAPTAGSFVPCVVLSALAGATMPIWIVPAIIVSLGRSGATQSQIDDEAVATAAELERDAIATRMRETLAAEELVAKLEDGYAQSLRGVLESPTPAAGNTAARARVLSGLSRIAIARSRNGDEWLVVCARASAGIGDQPPRYFESCWSEPVTPDKYGNAEWMRAVLATRTRELALQMAHALRDE